MSGSLTLIPSDASNVFAIQLLEDDINYIKSQDDLGTGESNSYLSISESAVVDMSRNNVVAISKVSPLQVDNFISDTSPPILRYFSLDMTQEL